jgi:ribosome-associated translation inhibitor RaiA
MNLILLHGSARCPLAIDRLIETRLLALADRQQVDEACVRLSDDREASPRYQASMVVRVPGPDIHATVCGQTLRVAVERALDQIEAQVDARLDRRRRSLRRQFAPTGRPGRRW